MTDSIRYAIYPGIGIARLGNAAEAYFVGPQVPGEVPDGPYKDDSGAVKRQAALFRIYELDASGNAVREVTAADAQIEWRVHLANRKAAWYQFANAMDLGSYAQSSLFRNHSVTGDQRKQLVIDPGSRWISGPNQAPVAFDAGTFMSQSVYLGELRTDANGRLLVLGGRGHSAPAGTGYSPATTFANNDGWHDDTSDGTVRATIRIGDQSIEAEPAVVVCAPPNFGQGLLSVVTMYDVAVDVFVRELGWITPPETLEFWRDIHPIFQRLSGMQWVNQGIFFLFGANSPGDFTSAAAIAQLSDPSPSTAVERHRLFNWFLDPDAAGAEPTKLPPFYGDGFGDYTNLRIDGLFVTRTQYAALRRWADGDFVPGSAPVAAESLEGLPVADQPRALDRAALENCLGGPFHPGIELTWPMRRASMWASAFRLKLLAEDAPVVDDYGPILTPDVCLGATGPLDATGPGTLSRWMGVPWQTDEASCLAGYDASTYLPLPTFWAARVPNQVLSQEAYQRALDQRLPRGQRAKHFDYRQFWMRDLGAAYQQRINDMVARWNELGIIAPLPGPTDADAADLPTTIWAETQRSPEFSRGDSTWQQLRVAERVLDVPAEAHPALAAEQLASETATPLRRRRYGRGDR